MKILITGASSGIGYALAVELAKRKHKVYITTHTKKEIKNVLRKAKKDNICNNISVFKLDITKQEDRNLILKLDLDVLVNQAGIGIGGSLLDMPVSDIRKNFEVNYFSTLELTKLFISDMFEKDKKGVVLITSSLAGLMPFPFLGSYCSTKSSLLTMGICLNEELKKSRSKVKIKLILPGAYKTGFNQLMIENKAKYIDDSKYFIKPEEIIDTQKKIFNIIESRDLSSIVFKMVEAIESDNNKLIYKAPLNQRIFTKLYMLLFK